MSAALELVDAGHDVTVLEARPTLGGAVQTLPRRAGDPEPPPDNGQHIALGCFGAYIGFLERVGTDGSLRRLPLELRVIDERGRVSTIRDGVTSLLRYAHLPVAARFRVALALAGMRGRSEVANERTFGDFLRKRGQSDAAIDRFWDVFMRPALNLRSDEAAAEVGLFTVQTALLAGAGASDVLLPTAPLGQMHGEAAGRALTTAGARIRTQARVTDVTRDAVTLDGGERIGADGIVVAVPPGESARLLGEPEPPLADSPIVSVHLLFDRRILDWPLAALLGSDAHWVFDRGALTGHEPERGQYLTVVSSGAPELLELRGRELVDRLAGQLIERLGAAELLWSRVSREPHATIALRPNALPLRASARTPRPNVARAGAWTDTGWPATMEGAVRSGITAARVLSDMATKIAA